MFIFNKNCDKIKLSSEMKMSREVKMIKNIEEAEYLLSNKPLRSASAERILILNEIMGKNKELSQPKRFALMLRELLDRVSVPIEEYDIIAGRALDRELTEDEEAIFKSFIKSPDYPRRSAFLDSGHCTYSWQDVVELGLIGLKKRAEESLSKQTDTEKRDFLDGVIGVYSAIERYIERYEDTAKLKGMTALAETLRKARTEKPSDFVTALQLLWIVALIDCAYITPNPTLTVGRLDQLLYPLYKKDVESGRLTPEQAERYITDYYCKHNLFMGRGEHQVGNSENATTFDRMTNFDAPQYLLLAGTDENGNSAVNELTYLFARCIRPKFKNPVIVVRYYKGMDLEHPELWKILTEKALQSASMMFYNDDNVISAFKRLGIPDEQCRRYGHFGCNWASIGDNSAWMQGGPMSRHFRAYESDEERKEFSSKPYMRTNTEHGWPEDLNIILHGLADKEDVTIEDVYTAFFDRMGEFIDRKLRSLAHELEIRQRHPARVLTYGDCFFTDSVTNAECFSAGAEYHFEFQAFQMFGTVADSFITVDKLVFIDKKLTLKELMQAVDDNFVGHERVLNMVRRVEKYGSNTAFTNAHARRLSKTAMDMVIEKSKPYLKKMKLFLEPCMQSDTWHLKFGETYGATPNGRLAGASFSQNARPTNGACINGLTGMLNSMLSVPSDGLVSGALNLDIQQRDFRGESGRANFAALLSTYFNGGGLHAQVSCVNVEDLRDAQINPADHKDLRVRVTGYSGVFVDICKRLQDDIIDRLSH